MSQEYTIIGKINKECDLCRTDMDNNVIKEKGQDKLYVRCPSHTPKEAL